MRRIFAAIPLNRSPYNGSLPSLILEKLKSILGDAGKGLYEKFIKSPVDVYDINDKTPAIKNTWNNAGVAANGFGHNMVCTLCGFKGEYEDHKLIMFKGENRCTVCGYKGLVGLKPLTKNVPAGIIKVKYEFNCCSR